MATKKTIAIIGALEEKGREAIQYLTGQNYRLLLFYKETEDPAPAKKQTNGSPETEWISCPVEASWEADIIILAISQEEQQEVISGIKVFLTGKPVIDLGNEAGTVKELETSLPHSDIFSVLPQDIDKLIQHIIKT